MFRLSIFCIICRSVCVTHSPSTLCHCDLGLCPGQAVCEASPQWVARVPVSRASLLYADTMIQTPTRSVAKRPPRLIRRKRTGLGYSLGCSLKIQREKNGNYSTRYQRFANVRTVCMYGYDSLYASH